MSLLTTRHYYKPFQYNEAFEHWLSQQQSFWLHTEINMDNDIYDWKFNLTDDERYIIGSILKSFVQSEILIGDYWRKLGGVFQIPEIGMMCSAFSNMECFDDETELLTDKGWVNVKDIDADSKVAQYDIKKESVNFVKPLKVVNYDYKGKMHYYKSKTADMCVTPNHKLILKHPFSKKVMKRESQEGKWGRNYLYPTAVNNQEIGVVSAQVKLLIAIQADGNLRANCPSRAGYTDNSVSLNLTKERKKERLVRFLDELGIPYNTKNKGKGVIYQFNIKTLSVNNESIKEFGFLDLEKMTAAEARAIIDEALFWDGSSNYWYNTNECAVDKLQAVGLLAGISVHKGVNRKKGVASNLPQGSVTLNTKTCFVLSFSDRVWRTYPQRKEVDYDSKVYCVSVPTQNLVSRRNGKVSFTGNTIHIAAYAYLNDCLGIDNWQEFLQDEVVTTRLAQLSSPPGEFHYDDYSLRTDDQYDTWRKELAISLATFSAFGEGVALFSAFTILLSFAQRGLMKGLGQIIEMSIRDESLHAKGGVWLFNTFISENKDIHNVKKPIYEAASLTIEIEDRFIDQVFAVRESRTALPNCSPEDLKQFIRQRCNNQLRSMHMRAIFNIDKKAVKNLNWFNMASGGDQHADFFASRVTQYAKTDGWGGMWL